MSSEGNRGKVPGDHLVNAAALQLGYGDYAEVICGAIRRAAERHPHGMKYIARSANSNIRTVESWAAKRSTPDGLHLLRLMATVPEVQSEVRRLAGMQADLDPAFERDFHQLIQTYQRIREGR